jgi:meso-butanediol dehydrogenase / (S,S)-butanediol dehydrogenase / diacetyl reductase
MSKTIVITGAGSGLGRAMARVLAKDGHRLILLGRTASKVEDVARELGGEAWAARCDVADAASVRSAFGEIAARAEAIDVLINNAAVYEPYTIEEASEEQIAAALDTNLSGTIHCTRAAVPLMGKGGHIINVSSRTVVEPAVMLALYQTSKAGVERFTASLREEVAERGIRVTLLRAAGMMEAGMNWTLDPEVTRRFQEARRKRGIDRGNNAVSQFASVAQLLPWLIGLPQDVGVTELMLEARHP